MLSALTLSLLDGVSATRRVLLRCWKLLKTMAKSAWSRKEDYRGNTRVEKRKKREK